MDSSPPPSPPSSHQSCALHVGCEFDTVESLKQLCHDLAIEDGFEFKPRSSKTAYTIVCKGEGCVWRLYASSIDSSRRFRIKTFNSKHSCFGINHGGNKQATAALIASKIAGKLKDQPNYRPSDIVIDMKRELGIEISYSKALRARDVALVLSKEHMKTRIKTSLDIVRILKRLILRLKPSSSVLLKTNFNAFFSVTAHAQSDLHIVVLFLVSTELI